MIDVAKNGKIKIHWKVSPYDYSKDKEKEIISLTAKKYGIPKDRIKVSADFVLIKDNGQESSLTDGVIDNIQDPVFQEKLFKEYLRINNIENYDYDIITSIDKEINGKIDYQIYDKFRRFTIKWIKFSNFQSYGTNNSFDFSTLHGLVLLNGDPANQSGKTTFAVDLLHFLLFGKSEKADVQADIFNKFLPNETNVIVEGCISIEGEDYIIKRTLSRPKIEKRTEKSKTSQKVEYYHVVGNDTEELEDYVESESGEDSRKTNKIIKESIGREEDFDLIMCITGSNLDSLINEKPTDRGRLLSRWIGLLPLENKDALAREKYNAIIKPSLITNKYNREDLKQEYEAYTVEISNLKSSNETIEKNNKSLEEDISTLEDNKKTLLESKLAVDTDVLKIDISTLRHKKESVLEEGKIKKNQLDKISEQIREIGDVDFSVDEYDKLVDNRAQALVLQQSKRNEALRIKSIITQLKTSEYCPTCGRKLDNVDNSSKIKEQEDLFNELVTEGKKVTDTVNRLNTEIDNLKKKRELYTTLSSFINQKPILELNLEKLRNEYKELQIQENEYNKNADAIDKNNKLDISIRNTDTNINTKRKTMIQNVSTLSQNKSNIAQYEKEIEKRKKIIEEIDKEEKLIYNWNLYLTMVGKNGISKMVMRKALPIINARLSQLLDDVCDFDVSVEINNKNEVAFKLIKDGIASDLSSGSGFEKTAAALALRSILADISRIPRMGGLVLDEIFGRVSRENYDNMHTLFERISKSYDYVFLISHNDEIKDMCNTCVTVTKTSEGISSIKKTINAKTI